MARAARPLRQGYTLAEGLRQWSGHIARAGQVAAWLVSWLAGVVLRVFLSEVRERKQHGLRVGFQLIQQFLELPCVNSLEQTLLAPLRVGARLLQELTALVGQRDPDGAGVLAIGAPLHQLFGLQRTHRAADPR